jgi:hypothetical protein
MSKNKIRKNLRAFVAHNRVIVLSSIREYNQNNDTTSLLVGYAIVVSETFKGKEKLIHKTENGNRVSYNVHQEFDPTITETIAYGRAEKNPLFIVRMPGDYRKSNDAFRGFMALVEDQIKKDHTIIKGINPDLYQEPVQPYFDQYYAAKNQ